MICQENIYEIRMSLDMQEHIFYIKGVFSVPKNQKHGIDCLLMKAQTC